MMIRRRNKGFKLARKFIRVFKWCIRKTHKYTKLNTSTTHQNKTISRLCNWICKLKQGLLNTGSTSTRKYIQLGHDTGMDTKLVRVPKGHIAIHVGEPEGETQRVLVPVLFINHPLFERLLKEAENVYGFDHPGRITVPCPISEFENVKTRIAATGTKCRQPLPGCFANVTCLST